MRNKTTRGPGERFPVPSREEFYGFALTGIRNNGASFGVITAHGRSSKAERQAVADQMALITETATVGKPDGDSYLVTFEVTHRVVPREKP